MADLFEAEYELITEGDRSPKWVQGHKDRLRLHLRPFFKGMAITEIDSGKAQSYRLHRAKQFGRLPPKGPDGQYVRPPKPPSRSTIHDEIGTLSLVLQTAYRHRKIHGVPDLSPPYRQQKKIIHRPWFTLAEYKQLYKAVAKAAREAPERYKYAYEQLYDQILVDRRLNRPPCFCYQSVDLQQFTCMCRGLIGADRGFQLSKNTIPDQMAI